MHHDSHNQTSSLPVQWRMMGILHPPPPPPQKNSTGITLVPYISCSHCFPIYPLPTVSQTGLIVRMIVLTGYPNETTKLPCFDFVIFFSIDTYFFHSFTLWKFHIQWHMYNTGKIATSLPYFSSFIPSARLFFIFVIFPSYQCFLYSFCDKFMFCQTIFLCGY